MDRKIYLSLIIPVYNEADIISATLLTVKTYLDTKKYSYEIIVIDDGSKDKTMEKVTSFGKGVKFKKIKRNSGKGAALREGVLASRGKYIIFTDADLSVPIDNIDIFLEKLKSFDVVIGSRRIKGAKIEIHQPWLRESMGRVYTFLSRLVTGVRIKDFTCGFKAFSGIAGEKIFANSVVDRWAYDSEILFLAKKLGFKIKEVPVSWKNREESRVVLGIDTFSSFRDLFMIRIYDWLGKYDKKN